MNGHKGFLTPRRLLVVALAILSVGIIVTVRYINASGTHAGYEYERGRDDTINVAIAYKYSHRLFPDVAVSLRRHSCRLQL